MPKKDFTKNNPALAFISAADQEEQEEQTEQEANKGEIITPTPGKPPKGYKINPEFIEVKSQRLNLLLQPSLVKRIKKYSKNKKQSVNETISQIIIEKLDNEGF